MRPCLLLVDGHHVAYRAFHALPASLSASDGTPTGAVLGFARVVGALRNAWRPSHLAVVLDGGLPEFRKELWPAYKAQRPTMPDALRVQMTLIEEFLAADGVPWLRIEGQESDDVMATLARSAAADGADVLIATGDKDLLQVVNDRVHVVRPDAPAARVDPAGVVRLVGVPPNRVPELLALTGDAADNIPGVEGIGPKTARRLIEQFPSLTAMWADLDSIEPRRLRQRLREARPSVERNLEMVRLREDLIGLPDWTSLERRPPAGAPLRAFAMRLGLRSLLPDTEQPELF